MPLTRAAPWLTPTASRQVNSPPQRSSCRRSLVHHPPAKAQELHRRSSISCVASLPSPLLSYSMRSRRVQTYRDPCLATIEQVLFAVGLSGPRHPSDPYARPARRAGTRRTPRREAVGITTGD
jgi:hypothetical protein